MLDKYFWLNNAKMNYFENCQNQFFFKKVKKSEFTFKIDFT